MGVQASREEAKTDVNKVAEHPSNKAQSACPVVEPQAVYNVYNQKIDAGACPSPNAKYVVDPRNNMPLEPNQQPFPGQKQLLSTVRLQSTIPKGGTETTWVYPSPQMFYNALKRKKKGDDVTERDMESVVFAHNTMNEVTWAKVLQWEALHRHECQQPRLRRFLGRPDQLSPLAWLQGWTGGQLPFDRHDWYIDRCGTEVRYVIDFYFHEDKAGTPEAFTIRARPALDSLEALLDRTKMRIYRACARYGLPCPITGSPSSFGPAEQEQQAQSNS